jgi:hypothetical protein
VSLDKRSIHVINPDGGVGWTNRKKAGEYVSRGRARWKGPSAIEFITDDHRALSVARAAKLYVSGDGFASLKAVKGLPAAGDVIRLFIGKRPPTPPREDRICLISVRPMMETFLSSPVQDGQPA